MSAFSTLSRAVAFAIGRSSGSPASGLITTNAVVALNTSSGSVDFFLSFAFAGTTKSAVKRTSEETRVVMAGLRDQRLTPPLYCRCAGRVRRMLHHGLGSHLM